MTQDPISIYVVVDPAENKPYQSKGNSRWYTTAGVQVVYHDTSYFGGGPDVSIIPYTERGSTPIVVNISPAAMTAIAEWWLQQEEAYK